MEKRTKVEPVWVGLIGGNRKKALKNAIKDLKEGGFTEVREILDFGRLRVWYIKNGKLKSHIWRNEELEDKELKDSFIPNVEK